MFRKPVRAGKSASKARATSSASVPAATSGWDTLSPLSDMKRDRAVILDNFFPEAGYLRVRNGFEVWAGVGTHDVESLLVYNGITASKMFAAAGTVIYDVSTRLTASSSLTSLNNARWQGVNFTTSGGHFLVICNGADFPRTFDGTNWATPTITVVDETNFVHVEGHKHRLWFTLRDSTQAAYLPLDSIAGAATVFDFGAVFTDGGTLQCIGTWTRDGGIGPDDYLVALSSKGQAAVYGGADVAGASTWYLVGVYSLPAPIGRRCMLRTGTDIAIITISGVISLEAAMQKDKAAAAKYSLMPNIQPSVTSAAKTYGDNFGWELVSYPAGSTALLNVPLVEAGTAHQYGVNTTTGAPFRFTGINAQCWALYNEELFFGAGDGAVNRYDDGPTDAGVQVDADVQGAFWDCGAPGETKQIKLVQPLIVSDGAVSPAIAINVDFATGAPTSPVGRTAPAGSLWDDFLWDEGIWAEGLSAQSDWIATSAIGQWISIRTRVSVNVGTDGMRFDVGRFDTGRFGFASQPVTLQLNGYNIMYERGVGL